VHTHTHTHTHTQFLKQTTCGAFFFLPAARTFLGGSESCGQSGSRAGLAMAKGGGELQAIRGAILTALTMTLTHPKRMCVQQAKKQHPPTSRPTVCAHAILTAKNHCERMAGVPSHPRCDRDCPSTMTLTHTTCRRQKKKKTAHQCPRKSCVCAHTILTAKKQCQKGRTFWVG